MKPKPVINKVWTFPSSSGRGTYETMLYADRTMSCNCRGWTQRLDFMGNRSCKHTRFIDLGRADAEAINCHDYTTGTTMMHTGEMVRPAKPLKRPAQNEQAAAPGPTYRRKLSL